MGHYTASMKRVKETAVEIEQATHVYVGAAPCGCRVSVVTELLGPHKKYTAKSVARYINDGYTVTRETFEEYCKRPVAHCTHR